MVSTYPDDAFGTLGHELKNKLSMDNDAKVIIVGKNAGTGLGKTTLAIHLCRFIDEDWDPRDTGAYWDVDRYEHDYNNYNIESGSATLLDELEIIADSRRSMSNRNLKLSQTWARLRNRNVLNIATLPSTQMLDNRLEYLADYWILVEERGRALPHRLVMNDYTGKLRFERFEGEERIFWEKIPKSDKGYKYIEEKKTNMKDGNIETISLADHEERLEKELEKKRKELRNQAICDVYEASDLSTTQLAEMDWTEVSQSQVAEILRT